jgi:hypothetical protein
MQSRENDETMDIEDAAWHLSSIANYDFGDVVSCFGKFQSDTLYYNINVENGKVYLSDLNSLYTRASADITAYFNNLNLENKHIRFIGADIEDCGSVAMPILVSSGWPTQPWYFPDALTLYNTLSPYYDDEYLCDLNTFTDTLQFLLNELVAYHPSGDNTFFVVFKTVYFNYNDYQVEYTPTNYGNYRIFKHYTSPLDMCANDFFYYFDSYAGLAVDSCRIGITSLAIIDFNITIAHPNTLNHFHIPRVRYGSVVTSNPNLPPVN